MLALAAMTGAAFASEIRYTWKAQGGGLLNPFTREPMDKATVFMFDANIHSADKLVANAKAGAPLADQPFVLAKEITDGVIASGDVFAYADEAVGVEWEAYMAIELEKNGKRYVYVSSEVRVTGLDLGFPADITFGDQFAYACFVKENGGPGWYEVGVVNAVKTICPGTGKDEIEISAVSADAAVGLVKVMAPAAATVSDADYAKYFKMTAMPLSEGKYLVRAELDATSIELDRTVVSFAAQLSSLAQKVGTTVTVEIECKPGLSYRVIAASEACGPYANGEATQLATGEKTEVKVKVPEGDNAFFRIGAMTKPVEE